jgi:hypothetical protein
MSITGCDRSGTKSFQNPSPAGFHPSVDVYKMLPADLTERCVAPGFEASVDPKKNPGAVSARAGKRCSYLVNGDRCRSKRGGVSGSVVGNGGYGMGAH